MSKTVAVMDLGTNTFHLLIAEVSANGFSEIAHDFEGAKLGEGGINKGFIQPAAFERGVKAMQKFNMQIKEHNVQQVKAIATSALRNAANGNDFIEAVKTSTGIEIEIIDGQYEAAYIYEGVKASNCLSANNSLIMDIGGGSVEFILCTDKTILWKQSFEIGAARLIDLFHRIDPIPHDAIQALDTYLGDTLHDLFNATQGINIDKLIGSAGAFETFTEVIELDKGNTFDIAHTKCYDYDLQELINATDMLIKSSHKQRTQMKGIIPIRVDMIVTASLITRYVMKKLNIVRVGMSAYSLKEGVLASMM